MFRYVKVDFTQFIIRQNFQMLFTENLNIFRE